MRGLSDLELEKVGLQSNLPMLRRACVQAQFRYAAARKGQKNKRHKQLKSARLRLLKAELRLAELEASEC